MVDKLVNTEANTKRIQFVESCFGNSGQPLLIPGRVLVGEGVLTKICRKKPKPRQFFLFNDILVYGNIVINKKKYNKQHIIPLEEVKIKSLPDEGSLKNGWLISSRSKSFAVYAATSTEKSEWIAHINKCISDLLIKTGKVASSEYAAPWIPDSEASQCMHCKKSQFTLINRRHHCRNCGLVVCNMCANKKFLLPHQSSHPLRVCLTCYDRLSKTIDRELDPTGANKSFTTSLNQSKNDANNSNSDSSSSDNDEDLPSLPSENPSTQRDSFFTTSTPLDNNVDPEIKNPILGNHHNALQGDEERNNYVIRRSPPPIPPPPISSIEKSLAVTDANAESINGKFHQHLVNDLKKFEGKHPTGKIGEEDKLIDLGPDSEIYTEKEDTKLSKDLHNIVLN
ncbi:unnamed protein product [Gordionus sp. m RMFG-2023]